MTIHECLVPFSSRTLQFVGWRGVLRVQKLLWFYIFFDFWAPEYVKKWSKNTHSFLVCFMTVHGCLVQFQSRMLRFSGRRKLEESRTAVVTRSVLSLSTRIHVIVMKRWKHWKIGKASTTQACSEAWLRIEKFFKFVARWWLAIETPHGSVTYAFLLESSDVWKKWHINVDHYLYIDKQLTFNESPFIRPATLTVSLPDVIRPIYRVIVAPIEYLNHFDSFFSFYFRYSSRRYWNFEIIGKPWRPV